MPTIRTYLTNKNLFLFGLVLVLVGMTMSRFLTSLGQFVLLGNWILEGGFKNKWQIIKISKLLWVLSSLFLLHLVGLFWTSDFDYAGNDLRVKLPLLWLPLLFITSKQILTKKEMEGMLWIYTASVLVASVICTMVWLGWTKHKVVDIREISIFNSHIRFALMIDLVICFLMYDFFKKGGTINKLLKFIIILWFISFLFILQAFTGFVILGCVLFYYAGLFILKQKKSMVKWSAIIVVLVISIFVFQYLKGIIDEQNEPAKKVVVRSVDDLGHSLYNDLNSKETENGNLVWVNICQYEIQQSWNQRSGIKFGQKDQKGNDIATTLVRYLSSKGYNKDAEGISKLTASDILWIQKGKSNYLYTNKTGIESRIYEAVSEINAYQDGKDPTGYSFLMRLEYWRIGMEIVKRNLVYGVGTGDIQNSFYNQYKYSKSKLKKEWQRRSHNQFLAITIAFGIIGLLFFLIYLFVPLTIAKNKHYLFTAFFIISILSMLTEDTLETQAGVSFFGLFYALFLVGHKPEEEA